MGVKIIFPAVIPETSLNAGGNFDPNLIFLREVYLGYNDDEIQQEV